MTSEEKTKTSKGRSNLVQRILTGVPLALGAIAAVWFGSYWFALLVTVAVFFAQSELNHMLLLKGCSPQRYVALLGALAMLGCAYCGDACKLNAVLLLGLMCACVSAVLGFGLHQRPLHDCAATWLVLGYCGWLPAHIVLLRQLHLSDFPRLGQCCWGDLGLGLVGFILVVCIATDVGAYAVGKACGSHKLCPKVSPGKTIEGALGGLVVALLSSWVWSNCSSLPLGHCLILGGIGSIVAQFGDLFESSIKREAQIKDSGNLIAGHGGALDRLDSFLLVIPWFYLYINLVM